MILTVHDNAMLDCSSDELDELAVIVPKLMSYAPVEAVVPITPEPEVSDITWADLRAYGYEAA